MQKYIRNEDTKTTTIEIPQCTLILKDNAE